MPTVATILEQLRSSATEKTRLTFARHGHPYERTLGVSIAELKAVAKTIRREQALALELYATGLLEPMYLAGIVASGVPMTTPQLQSWADGTLSLPMIAEYTVPWVTVENAAASRLASHWIKSSTEQVATAGWCTWSGLLATKPDDALDLPEVAALLEQIPATIGKAKNRVRYTMNTFVISVALYVTPLLQQAKAAAKALGPVEVDMGDTACSIPLASASIEKAEAAGRIGKKRKTIRC